MRFISGLVLVLSLCSSLAYAKIVSQKVEYKEGDSVLEGYLAYDDTKKGPRPAVIVVHEWQGLDDYAKSRSRELAAQGYVAFAADIYGKGVNATDLKAANELSTKYKSNRPLLRARIKAAFDQVSANKMVKKDQIMAIGFCFGGTTVLELARSGAPVAGVVSFHGGLDSPTPNDAKNIKAKVLVLHGAVDPFVKPEEVNAFMKELNDAKVDYQFISYANAVHKFSNPEAGNDPSKGFAYNESAEKRSLIAMKDFFAELTSSPVNKTGKM